MGLTTILLFIRSPLGKILGVIALLGIIYVGFNWWLSVHDDAIREALTNQYRLEQLEQLTKERELFDSQITYLREQQQLKIEEIRAQRDVLARRNQSLVEEIRSGKYEGSGQESSPVLRETLKELQQRRSE